VCLYDKGIYPPFTGRVCLYDKGIYPPFTGHVCLYDKCIYPLFTGHTPVFWSEKGKTLIRTLDMACAYVGGVGGVVRLVRTSQ